MIALGIIAWVLCAGITCGAMMHVWADEWADSPILCMAVCIVSWWLFAILGIGYLVVKQLSKIGMFFAGLIDKVFEKKEEQDD